MKRPIKQTCTYIAAAINAKNYDLAKRLIEQVTYASALSAHQRTLAPRHQPTDSPRPTTRSTAQ